mmetsp:Transcript_116570/g.341149  ORF Transcript_116570/g.341149 Transcript_116570/m.341149 type:complete len:205 (-) Transcript_116570:679-1293(-)
MRLRPRLPQASLQYRACPPHVPPHAPGPPCLLPHPRLALPRQRAYPPRRRPPRWPAVRPPPPPAAALPALPPGHPLGACRSPCRLRRPQGSPSRTRRSTSTRVLQPQPHSPPRLPLAWPRQCLAPPVPRMLLPWCPIPRILLASQPLGPRSHPARPQVLVQAPGPWRRPIPGLLLTSQLSGPCSRPRGLRSRPGRPWAPARAPK